jgi:hypothetical protein
MPYPNSLPTRTRWSLTAISLLLVSLLAYGADPVTLEDPPNDFFFLFTPLPSRGPDYMDVQRVNVDQSETELIFQLKPYGQLRRLTTSSPEALGSYSFFVDVDGDVNTGTLLRAFPGFGLDVQVELDYFVGTLSHQLKVGLGFTVEIRPSGPAGPINLEFNDLIDTITFKVSAPQLQQILASNGSTATVNPQAMKWFVLTSWAPIPPGCFPPPPVLPPICVVVPVGDIVPNEVYKP